MADIGSIVLHKLLEERSLDAWTRLKAAFFGSSHTSIYSAINKHYLKHQEIPGFEDLLLLTRDGPLKRALKALEELETPDVDLDLAIEALINEFSQNEALLQIDKFVDRVTMMDTDEVKDEIAHILMYLDEKTHTSEKIATMSDMNLFNIEEAEQLFPMGLNNKYDSALGGCAPQELVLFGGYRGSGKSVVSTNLMVNQYLMGNSSVYFSIEMRAQEVFSRTMSILADVNNTNLMRGQSSQRDMMTLAHHRAEMFVDAQDLLEDYLVHKDFDKFEQKLNHEKLLKPDNQMVIIDDQRLTIPNIDLHLQNFKAQFGDKLKLVVVDYVNQIVADDMYNWQTQLTLSKELKNLARKHNVCIVAPYQIDATGEARYSKGILDAADRAFVLKPQEHETGIFSFETTKMRNGTPMNFSSMISWQSLKISPVDVPFTDREGGTTTTKRKAPKAKQLNKMSDDLSY